MNKLNFGTYTKILKEGINFDKNDKPITNKDLVTRLLGLVLSREYLIDGKMQKILNKNNEEHDIKENQASKWINGQEKIPEKIRTYADKYLTEKDAYSYFKYNIYPLLSKQLLHDTCFNMFILINSDKNISLNMKNQLFKPYDSKHYCVFLANTFLYALQQENKLQSMEFSQLTISQRIEFINNNQLKPNDAALPSEIQTQEKIYTREILKAYVDGNVLDELSFDKLKEIPKYNKTFQRERTYYHAAEYINRAYRDIHCDNDKVNQFDLLKQDVFDGIISVHEDDYDNGLKRLNEVMKEVTKISLDKSFLTNLYGWIGNAERKGLCHMLVNDKEMTWVIEDE